MKVQSPPPSAVHVLAVDDDPMIRQLIVDYLGDNDIRVTALPDGRLVEDVLARETIDLLIVDVKLPGENGMRITRRLRDESDLPIILLTGKCEEADRVMGLLAFIAVGEWAAATGNLGANALPGMVAGLLAIAGMGIQNALSRTSLAELGSTTIMTGNTTQVVIDLVDLASAGPEQASAIRARLRKMLPSVASFAAGAVLGALVYVAAGFWSVLLPVALLVWLTFKLR